MSRNFKDISIKQICDIIDLLHPCMDDYIYVYDLQNDFYYISPAAVERFKIENHSFNDVTNSLKKLVYEPDFPVLMEELQAVLSRQKAFHELRYQWLSKDDEPMWIDCRGYVIWDEDTPLYMVGCINEIGTVQKADNISGLLGLTTLQELVSNDKKLVPKGYVMRLGLDDFKEVNEKLGTDYGNGVLKKTAACLSKCLLSGQQLFKAVADEFLIVDFEGHSIDEALEQYNNIRAELNSFVEETMYEVVLTISAGLLANEHCINNSFMDVMRLGEFSLNEAKRNGRNCCYVFEPADYDKFLRRRHLTQLIRQSITRNFEGFEAYLQPLLHTESNTLYGAETLMRFSTEEYGMVSPGEFIPILEETGLIMPVGKWMLHESLRHCKEIHKVLPDFKISINISYIQVLKSNIITEIVSAVREHQIPPNTVIIELTESGLVAPDSRISELWADMKKEGINLALDDFGTGYSNFHYINDLKPDIIKIDRSFTLKALQNEFEYKLLSLMSDMAHNMNLKVCIEGIENQDELERIRVLFPDYCQGFYFGRPCPYKEFTEKYVIT